MVRIQLHSVQQSFSSKGVYLLVFLEAPLQTATTLGARGPVVWRESPCRRWGLYGASGSCSQPPKPGLNSCGLQGNSQGLLREIQV